LAQNVGELGPKRRRTVVPKKLFNEQRSIPPKTVQPRQHTSLNLETFEETNPELKERQNVQAKLFTHTIQKYVTSVEISESCVSDVNCDASHLHEQQPSRVYYMELVDENPDSDETCQ
jgi:hypothetical protein